MVNFAIAAVAAVILIALWAGVIYLIVTTKMASSKQNQRDKIDGFDGKIIDGIDAKCPKCGSAIFAITDDLSDGNPMSEVRRVVQGQTGTGIIRQKMKILAIA